MDKNRLFLQAIGKFLLGVIVIGLLLFLPARSLQYWQAWLLMGLLAYKRSHLPVQAVQAHIAHHPLPQGRRC